MSNKMIIENKITTVKKYLKILFEYKNYAQEKIEADINLRGATDRYLYLAAQAAIDLAEAVVAYKKYRKPQSMAEAFEILQEEKNIDSELAQKMIKMVGFRNIIAYDYEKVDYAIVYNVLQNRLGDIEEFIKKMKKSINLR